MEKLNLGIVVGSARKASYSKQLAKAFTALLPDTFHIQFIKVDNLALYNQDYDDEGNTPADWAVFREVVKKQDAFLFVTPEYNRSFPPLMKNALDIASRPFGQNQWSGKPAAIISVSPGSMGGFGSNQHLRQVTTFLNLLVMPQPEAYVNGVDQAFDETGAIADDRTREFLQSIADSFVKWVEQFYK